VPKLDNKQIVFEVWKSFRTRSRDPIRPFLAPDIHWLAPAGNATALALGKPSGFTDRESMKYMDTASAYRQLFGDGPARQLVSAISD
jgi:uncharacterized protein